MIFIAIKKFLAVFSSAIILGSFVFAFKESNQFHIIREKENASQENSIDNLGNQLKRSAENANLAIVNSSDFEKTGDDPELEKTVDIVMGIAGNLFGLEKKEVLYFLGKQLENKKQIIKVPEDYRSIQLAIDSANTGDTIEVLPGEYKENIVMKEGVSVIAADFSLDSGFNPPCPSCQGGGGLTILDGNGFGNVVTFKSGITSKTMLAGFTIKNSGKNLSGILIEDSSPWIHDNVIAENEYNLYVKGNSTPVIQKNAMQFGNRGIQVYNFDSGEKKEEIQANAEENTARSKTNPIIIDNLITDNKIGIDLYNSSAVIKHNNISYNNHYKTYLGATYGINLINSSAEITSNIITDSGICELCAGVNVDEKSANVKLDFNNIWNNKNDFVCFGQCELGENNISEDPLFVDYINGDFRLSEDSDLIGKGEDGRDIGVRW